MTIRGAWPNYGFQQIVDFGMDGSVDWDPSTGGLQAVGGIVRAEHATPVPTHRYTGRSRDTRRDWPNRPVGALKGIKIHADLVAKQSLVNEQQDFVPTPEGYTLGGRVSKLKSVKNNPFAWASKHTICSIRPTANTPACFATLETSPDAMCVSGLASFLIQNPVSTENNRKHFHESPHPSSALSACSDVEKAPMAKTDTTTTTMSSSPLSS